MDIGVAKIMDRSRQDLQETSNQSTGSSAPTSANTCSNVPLDNGRAVALETTPNPLSYWPPPSLPSVNFFKEAVDDPLIQAPEGERSCVAEAAKSLKAEHALGNEENSPAGKGKEVSQLLETYSSSAISQSTRILHHNLPPIAGITSSHNYRGAREIQKHLSVNTIDPSSKRAFEKIEPESNRPNGHISRTQKEETTEEKILFETQRDQELQKESINSVQSIDEEVVEVPRSPSLERPKTANAEYMFLVSPNFQKASSTPRVFTPFMQSSATNVEESLGEPHTHGNNSCSDLSIGSPSSSNHTTMPSHFMASSNSGGTVQCESSSDNCRVLASPHSNLSSPSSLNRAASHLKLSSFGEESRPSSSLHTTEFHSNNYNLPLQSGGSSLNYVTNSHSKQPSPNTPTVGNSSLHGIHSDSIRPRFLFESVEGDTTFKDISLQNQSSKSSRLDVSHVFHSSINSNSQQQPDRLTDGQPCKNSFNLPLPKSYLQNHPHHQQQQHHQQLQRYSPSNYSNTSKLPHDSYPKPDSFRNLTPTTKEFHRPSGTTLHLSNMKQSNSKVSDKNFDGQYNSLLNCVPVTLKKSVHSVEYSQAEGSVPRTSANSTRNDLPHRHFSKEMEVMGSKSNSVSAGNTWSDADSSADFANNIAYRNAQNVNKNLKVHWNEHSGRMMCDIGYQNSAKHGFQSSENLKNRFNLYYDKKKSISNARIQPSPLRPRFPPVPQSNYDLNRQIYDSMTGGNRLAQPPPLTRPLEKSVQQLTSTREHINVPTTSNKCQPYYRNFSEQNKSKNFYRASLIEQSDYSTSSKDSSHSSDAYSSFQGLIENHSAYQGKKLSINLLSTNPGFSPQIQPSESKLSQPNIALDHHRSSGSFSSGSQMIQTTCQSFTSERNRSFLPKQNPSTFSQKPIQDIAEYVPKKLLDDKIKGNPAQLNNSQIAETSIPSSQLKGKVPPSASVHARPKRESPLDLSVKTVRQSADSTAKDDGETYFQNFRNLLHGNQPSYSESHFPAVQLNDASTGAPKIDFTPNFSGFHAENLRSASPLHHNSDNSILPPVESFKKFSGKSVDSTAQSIRSKSENDFFSSAHFSSSMTSASKPQRAVADQTSLRDCNVDNLKMDYQKRLSNDFINIHPSQSKIPKIDSWKLAFDQQIEQRLNSARITLQSSQGADLAAKEGETTKFLNSDSTQHVISKHPSSTGHYRSANMYPQTPIQTSAAPYNPAYVQQPQCQPATPQTPQDKIEQLENVVHSPDPEQIIKQISKGVMPDYKLLQDKNVLSILRSSLEEKEAKLLQLKEAAKRKEKYKEFMTSEAAKRRLQPYEQTSKGHSKQSLPPFGALTLERMCAPPSFPGHRLNLPRSVDTVKIDVEPIQKYFSPSVKSEPEKSGIPSLDPSPQDDAQGPPTDLDGLAAFLAARIRTKGELKQVGPVLEPERTTSIHYTKSHLSAVTSSEESFDRDLSIYRTIKSPNLILSGNPPKLVRETRLMTPSRRRLFSHLDEEIPTTSNQISEYSRLSSRDPNGIRSSSETSVFDFRESDSESEMPVLERQTLEEMRRDRKTFGSKQSVSNTQSDETLETDKPETIPELDRSHPDPFWDTAFDMFVEQLEKRPPKRSTRKKKIFANATFSDMETECGDTTSAEQIIEKSIVSFITTDEDKSELKDEEICEDKEVLINLKKEAENKSKVIPDGHVKLSSSRLKIYREEIMKGNKINAMKIEKEREKSSKCLEKPVEENEKEREKQKAKDRNTQIKRATEKEMKNDFGMKTRGKSKILKKKVDTLDFESDIDVRDPRSESESTLDDDDDSLSLSGLESESSDSETSRESSNSNYSSFDDSENESNLKQKKGMRTRLQTRTSKQKQAKSTGMKLRSKAVSLPVTASKPGKKRKRKREEYYCSEKKKKPSFGDGSDFRPGWEEECYKFKQQLRMPEKLISISRPPKRSSVSLPDLDPYRNSPSFDLSDMPINKKRNRDRVTVESDESDVENTKNKHQVQSESLAGSESLPSLLKSRNGKKSSSILNMLVKKYGRGNGKKQKEVKITNERKSPRVLPKAANKPELLPTPSLGIGKENVLNNKKRSKDGGRKKSEEEDSHYLGYFRKKTVNTFKEAFKHRVGLISQEFNPVILKSRTRTQTKDMKKRATLIEVFGEERPASAPPLSREEEVSTDQEKAEKISEKKKAAKVVKKICGGVVTRGRGKLTRSGRPGLRSTAVLRSNKAVQISKRHLNSGRKRNIELLRIRAMASKKFSYLVGSSDASNQLPITKKRLKLRSVRRKFRSGFDYIRKKKKLKKDGDSADGSVKEKKLTVRPTSESVEDIQNEIKNWVINKGLGETILHRAARLGYTDVAAYCLEKMDCSPSPRDNAGYTPLHEACSRGHLEIAKLLLMYGASVSESAKGGIRPLHEAAENGFTELIRLLLSFGADPLLETYTGHTALSLVTDEEARRLIQHHLADVQGNVAPVWTFQGPSSLFDPLETGYDPLCEPPSPESVTSDCELEISDSMLPPLYRLTADRDADHHWMLLKDLITYTRAKSKDSLLKQLQSSSVREMKLSDFYEQGRCCNLLNTEKPPTKASKVILVSYDDKIRQLLDIEKVVL